MSWYRSIYLALVVLIMLNVVACTAQPKVNHHHIKIELVWPGQERSSSNDFHAKESAKLNQCRLTCFSYDPHQAFYPLEEKAQAKTIYVKGYVSVVGHMDQQGICRPAGYAKQDISKIATFKDLCKLTVESCGDNCWAGGNP